MAGKLLGEFISVSRVSPAKLAREKSFIKKNHLPSIGEWRAKVFFIILS